MDLSNPMSSVAPPAFGAVLTVLSRTGVALSGRQVAELTDGRFSRSRVHDVLTDLVASGVVLRESHPPAMLYRLNRDHVAAGAIEALAGQRRLLLDRMRSEVATWVRPASAVWLFGSAARGEGGLGSDIDVLVLRPNSLDEEDPTWVGQLATLAEHVTAWSGNSCEIVQLSRSEVGAMVEAGERLVEELRRDALVLHGVAPTSVLRRSRQAVES